ncbi:Protein ECM3, partial [Grifola frondosa]
NALNWRIDMDLPPSSYSIVRLAVFHLVLSEWIIRMICTGFGFAITKADMFPVVAARGAGQVVLNIALPCLMFSRIVPAFNSQNIGKLGPLVLVAVLYEVMGIFIAWVVKQFFWVPHRFRYGIIMAGGWGNYGDIPTSVIMSITALAPFNPSTDEDLSVAYLSAILLVWFITLFPLGGYRLIAMDFRGPEVEDEDVQEAMRLKRRAMLKAISELPHTLTKHHSHPQDIEIQDLCKTEKEKCRHSKTEAVAAEDDIHDSSHASTPAECDDIDIDGEQEHLSFHEDGTTAVQSEADPSGRSSQAPSEFISSRATSPAPSITHVATTHRGSYAAHGPPHRCASARPHHLYAPHAGSAPCHSRASSCAHYYPALTHDHTRVPDRSRHPAKSALRLRAQRTHPHPSRARRAAAARVHNGRRLLRRRRERPRGPDLPRLRARAAEGAAAPVARAAARRDMRARGGKMVVMPVMGVVVCEGLTDVGVIDRNDKVLRFVCIFFSCLPTATVQVYLTQIYSSAGNAEHISAFLIPQYILMLFGMTILTAYSIHLLFY